MGVSTVVDSTTSPVEATGLILGDHVTLLGPVNPRTVPRDIAEWARTVAHRPNRHQMPFPSRMETRPREFTVMFLVTRVVAETPEPETLRWLRRSIGMRR